MQAKHNIIETKGTINRLVRIYAVPEGLTVNRVNGIGFEYSHTKNYGWL